MTFYDQLTELCKLLDDTWDKEIIAQEFPKFPEALSALSKCVQVLKSVATNRCFSVPGLNLNDDGTGSHCGGTCARCRAIETLANLEKVRLK